jgi:hypothetical protein
MLNDKQGIYDLSLIPAWLINFDLDSLQTSPNSPGIEIGKPFSYKSERWQRYIKVVGNQVFQYIRNCETGEEIEGGEWTVGIPDSLILEVDSSKITNWCDLFAKVTTPIANYKDPVTNCVDPNVTFLPVVLTEDCKLTVATDCPSIKKCVIPALVNKDGLPIWEYNPITDTVEYKPERLLKLQLDGTTVRVAGEEGTTNGNPALIGDSFLTSHTYANPDLFTGEGTPDKPLDLKIDPTAGNRIEVKDGGLFVGGIGGSEATGITPADNMLDGFVKYYTFNVDTTSGLSMTYTHLDQPNSPDAVLSKEVTFTAPALPEGVAAGKRWVARISGWIRNDRNAVNVYTTFQGRLRYGNAITAEGTTSTRMSIDQVSGAGDSFTGYSDSTGHISVGSDTIYINPGQVISINLQGIMSFPAGTTPANWKIPVFYPTGNPPASAWFTEGGWSLVILGLSEQPERVI